MIQQALTREEMTYLAGTLAQDAPWPGLILLEGGLGAGKTTFAKAFINALSETPVDVVSPTFTLVQTYDTKKGPLFHADLYRLKVPEEVEELGLLEAFSSAICLVEWPDRLGPFLPKKYWHITLTVVDENHRSLQLEKKT
jgi:tRNA threonylcarbamoyl adenosine modification protein YjeE